MNYRDFGVFSIHNIISTLISEQLYYLNNVVAFDESGSQVGIVFETPALMNDIIAWTNDMLATKYLHPILIISVFIVVFLEIHPFQDENGRLSRVLTTLLLLRSGYAYVPYSSLESIIEQSKEGYYFALRQTQGTIRTEKPNWQSWIIYFLRVLVQQSRNLAKKVESQKMILSKLPKLSLQILDYAKQHSRVTMSDIIKFTDVSRNTLKEHFRVLIEKGYLILRGKGRGSWYELP